MDRVVSLEEALRIVQEHAQTIAAPIETETVGLWTGPHSRILAETISATRDQPAFDRSTRDGFAVRAADLSQPLTVIGLLRAGEQWTGPPLGENEAIEIMTGAPLPSGADCVLMVEHAERSGDTLQPTRALKPGDNIVPRAAEARAGDVLLRPGQPLDHAAIAVAAGVGRKELTVYARPKVGIVATGDELVEPGSGLLEDWQIYNSNTYAIASLVAAAGGFPACMPIARDKREGFSDGLDMRVFSASNKDLAIFSGGVSMGKYDLVEQVLLDFGAEFFFTGVKIQPGKPLVFGRMPKRSSVELGVAPITQPKTLTGEWTYFFGLPGNPVSTEVCFHLFAATMLRALAGRTETAPQFVAAIAAEPFEGKPNLTRLLPARLDSTFREATVRPILWQGSGDTAANARANCYCVVEEQGIAAGAVARVLLR